MSGSTGHSRRGPASRKREQQHAGTVSHRLGAAVPVLVPSCNHDAPRHHQTVAAVRHFAKDAAVSSVGRPPTHTERAHFADEPIFVMHGDTAFDGKQKSMEETLWDSANKLRGTVESSEYKHVVLGLIFLKFVSDKFEARRKESTKRIIKMISMNDGC